MICFLLGSMLGFDPAMSAMMGVMEGLFETAFITLLYQRYFP